MKTDLKPRAELELDRFALDPYCKLYLPLWKLDGDSFMSKDAYGHLCTNHGSLWIPRGRSFDGVDDYVQMPYSESLNPAEFSVEAWAKVTGRQGAFRSVITSRDDKPQRGYIIYAGSNNKWQFWVGDGSGWKIITASAIVLDSWAHLVAVYSGGSLKFYVDDTLYGPTSATLSLNTARPLRIGAGVTEAAPDFYFPGLIGEVRIYNRVLTPQEILDHYIIGKEMFG